MFSDADGPHPGFTRQVHAVPPGGAQRADFSGRDEHRACGATPRVSAYHHAVTVTNQAGNTQGTAARTVSDARLSHRRHNRMNFRRASAGPVAVHQVTAEIRGSWTVPLDPCDG